MERYRQTLARSVVWKNVRELGEVGGLGPNANRVGEPDVGERRNAGSRGIEARNVALGLFPVSRGSRYTGKTPVPSSTMLPVEMKRSVCTK